MFCIGCVLSVMGSRWMRNWEGGRVREEFNRRASERLSAVDLAIKLNQQAVWSVESLYAASVEVERHEFRAFVRSTLEERSAIVALQWAPRVLDVQRAAHEAEGQNDGLAGYQIVEGGDARPASRREEYAPVFFSEPVASGAWRMGFDLFSDPGSAALMKRARASARPASSHHQRIVHAVAPIEGVVVFVPIYLNDLPHDTEEERRTNLAGFVVAVLRLDALVDEALRSLVLSGVRLRVFDEGREGRLLICSYPGGGGDEKRPARAASGLSRTRAVGAGGRQWTIECVPTREFSVGRATWLPVGVLVGGLLLTLLLTGYLLMLVGRTARVEQLVATRTDELARSNAELEQFAYVASHDLQEPLRMVSSFLQLLVERCGDTLDSESQEFIGYAVDGSHRMQALIRDLLAYSRVGRRGKPLAAVSCEDVLARVHMNLESAIKESGASVFHDRLPCVLGDDVELEQLFQNLISNAVKFRREEKPRVHVGATRNGSEWVFSVRDNGIGIEDKYRDRIFQMFQRLHTRSEYSGTGVGLAICQKIVERHGGRMWVESKPGRGSTFFFTLQAIAGEPT
jgi:signal transduction histidine kinase